jgi:FixJ family two-component response regulator
VSFLTKPVDREDLLRTVSEALAIDGAKRPKHEKLDSIRHRYETLDIRERQVFGGIAEGKLNKQLAPIVGVCERTIKALRAQMMVKMDCATIPELIRAAHLLGL